jgi:hypothetical protein
VAPGAAAIVQTNKCVNDINQVRLSLRAHDMPRLCTSLPSLGYIPRQPSPCSSLDRFLLAARNRSTFQVEVFNDARRRNVPVVRLPVIIRPKTAAGASAPESESAVASAQAYMHATDSAQYVAVGPPDKGLLRYLDLSVGMKTTLHIGNKLVTTAGVGNKGVGTIFGFADRDGVPYDPVAEDHSTTIRLRTGDTARVYTPPPDKVHYILVKIQSKVPFRFRGLPPGVLAIARTRRSVKREPLSFYQFPVRPR